jgi:hypothetical protein
MSPLSSPPFESRPTLLVGYGRFGRRSLRRLLASTAPRGILRWEAPPPGASPNERRLQDLALLWVGDRLSEGPESLDESDPGEGSFLEMMRDLYNQIIQVPSSGSAERDLAEAAEAAADSLLSASTRSRRAEGGLPLGLDVIVLAQPTSPEVIGLLDKMVTALMERLAGNANLTRGARGASVLHFLQVLDFENYWAPGPDSSTLRRTLLGSVQRWRRRQDAGQPAFGRIYLVDGRTQDGFREERVRIEETTLLLELMLFEGQRAGELQRLFQPSSPREALLATCSIRLFERSTGLLSRLAAARFSVGWLDYLAGQADADWTGRAAAVRSCLAPFSPSQLETHLKGDALDQTLSARLQQLEEALAELPIDASNWPELLEQTYEAEARRIEEALTAAAHAQLEPFSHEHLEHLPEQLRRAIDLDLHDPRRPVPLGVVLRELERANHELESATEAEPGPREPTETAFTRLTTAHQGYQRANQGWVDTGGLRRWWPCFALLVTAALAPLAVEALSELPKPDATQFLLTKAWELAQRLAHPVAVASVLFATVWALGAGFLQQRIVRSVERARAFFEDRDRGRLIARLRSELSPGGALRDPLEHLVDRLQLDRSLLVTDEARREIASATVQLRERQREMQWLRQQLREFLQMHGLLTEGEVPADQPLGRDGAGVRHALERTDDLARTLQRNPPTLDRFMSTQAGHQPFADWWRPWGGLFLHPIAFLERLSELYSDPLQDPQEEAISRRDTDLLVAALRRHGSFDLAFSWKAQDGLPPDRRYCLLPRSWQRPQALSRTLGDLRVSEENLLLTPDTGRVFLLRLQTGVEPSCLLPVETES